MRRRAAWVGLLLLTGCAAGLREGRFSKDGVRYRVVAPPEPPWRRVGFVGNDLAWAGPRPGVLIAVNATCKDHGDPTLDVLTAHLLIGFDERTLTSRTTELIDGRAALRSVYDVAIDGVPAEVEVVVLKKNGCIHDFTFIAPRGERAAGQGAFDALVQGFVQEASP